MPFINKMLKQPMLALKVAGVALIGLIILALAIQLLGASFRSLSGALPMDMGSVVMSEPGYGYGGGMYDKGEMYAIAQDASVPALSARNVASSIYPPQPPSPIGDTAEDFEVTQYSATIETRELARTCDDFSALKTRTDVIFESANRYDRGCGFSFKVKHESVAGVLAWLRAMDPKELSESTYTIKREIDDFTSEVEVLENKRKSIDETLTQALMAYDEITVLASRTENAEALAQVINSKIGIIERLTQEKININTALDHLARAKVEALDRLEYTYFSVNVYENIYIDREALVDSWKQAAQATVNEINTILVEATLGLLALLFLIAQWLLYALIALIVAKYGWKVGKYLWQR